MLASICSSIIVDLNWLVVLTLRSEKYEVVSWDDYSQYMIYGKIMKNNPNVPNHQPVNIAPPLQHRKRQTGQRPAGSSNDHHDSGIVETKQQLEPPVDQPAGHFSFFLCRTSRSVETVTLNSKRLTLAAERSNGASADLQAPPGGRWHTATHEFNFQLLSFGKYFRSASGTA
jgi:hypothetical protein